MFLCQILPSLQFSPIFQMPTIVRSDAVVDGGTESAGEDEPVEEAVWDRPMDEGTTFGGDYLDKTKSKEGQLIGRLRIVSKN